MRALVYTEEHALEVQDVAVPAAQHDELLLRVEASGICGSDVHGVASRSPRRQPPLIMGHEMTGTVVEAGGPAGAALVGKLVAVNPQVPCGLCLACRSGRENICGSRGLIGGTRPGGFSEFACVPLRCVHVLSEATAPEVAVFAEPLATCVHALELIGKPLPGTAVVLGAGTIGVLAIQLLQLAGATRIIVSEVDEERRRPVAAMATAVVAPEDLDAAVLELTGGTGADISLDAVGTHSTRQASLRTLQAGGTALWLGMNDHLDSPLPAFDVVVREQRVQGSFAYTNVNFARAVQLLESGSLRPAVPRKTFSLEQSARAFRDMLVGPPSGFLKAIITPAA